MQRQKIKNGNYLQKFFTQFPNIIDDADLDPYEYRLLIHYYRVGECWEGVRTTAEKCKMSTGKVSDVRKSLELKGWIYLSTDGEGVSIEVVDKTKENLEKYSKCSGGENGVHVVNESVHTVNKKRSGDEHKNNPVKNNHEEHEAVASGELFSAPRETIKQLSVYTKCVDAWLKEIHPGWSFTGAEGKAMKGIISQIQGYISRSQNGADVTDDQVVESFKAMCHKLPAFYMTKKLTVINSNLDGIIEQIKSENGKGFNQNTGATFREIYNIQSTSR